MGQRDVVTFLTSELGKATESQGEGCDIKYRMGQDSGEDEGE